MGRVWSVSSLDISYSFNQFIIIAVPRNRVRYSSLNSLPGTDVNRGHRILSRMEYISEVFITYFLLFYLSVSFNHICFSRVLVEFFIRILLMREDTYDLDSCR